MFEALFAIADTLRWLITLRLMFAGMFVGWLLGYGLGAGDDALIMSSVVGAAIGLVFDIRRGLTSRDTE